MRKIQPVHRAIRLVVARFRVTDALKARPHTKRELQAIAKIPVNDFRWLLGDLKREKVIAYNMTDKTLELRSVAEL